MMEMGRDDVGAVAVLLGCARPTENARQTVAAGRQPPVAINGWRFGLWFDRSPTVFLLDCDEVRIGSSPQTPVSSGS